MTICFAIVCRLLRLQGEERHRPIARLLSFKNHVQDTPSLLSAQCVLSVYSRTVLSLHSKRRGFTRSLCLPA